MFSTPRKVRDRPVNSCVTCGGLKQSPRKLNSIASERKGLQSLIQKYGGLTIIEGYVCRGCEQKMLRWENEIIARQEFYDKCQSNMSSYKRGVSDDISPLKIAGSPVRKESVNKKARKNIGFDTFKTNERSVDSCGEYLTYFGDGREVLFGESLSLEASLCFHSYGSNSSNLTTITRKATTGILMPVQASYKEKDIDKSIDIISGDEKCQLYKCLESNRYDRFCSETDVSK
jgi:hypothetical protein